MKETIPTSFKQLDLLTSEREIKEKMPKIDLPEKEPGDAILNYQKHMKKIKGFVDFAKADGSRDLYKKLNMAHPGRFEKAEDISELNGKY